MISIKKIIKDILYVSKLTGISKKKITVTLSVILSQFSAYLDIFIIVTFAGIITGNYEGIDSLQSLFIFINENKYFLVILVVTRFWFMYLQISLLKRLEINVKKNIQVYFLQEIFDRRNYSVADSFFYINTLSGHISFFYSNVASFMNSFLQIIAFATYLIISNPQTIFTFLGGLIFLYFPINYLLKKAREFMHKNYQYSRKTNKEIQRVVDNLFLIKILNKEKEEIDRFDKTITNALETFYQTFKYGTLNSFLPSFITLVVLSTVLSFEFFVLKITLDFVAITLRLFQSVGNVAASTNKIINSHVHMEKFYEIEKNKQIVIKKNFIRDPKVESSKIIEFKNVSFKYLNSETIIFENLNIDFRRNTHNLITGPNGSGKSTILGLMAGIFYASEGTVEARTNKFGFIGAVPLIFDGSLRDNILYGNNLEIEDNEIYDYLRLFDTFKEDSNYDLDKEISNKTLSSGQMQKVAFIRALLSDLEVLILDESTSNLDDYSRNLIFEILENKQVTIINSTHDPEKFKNIYKRYHINVEDDKRFIEEIKL
tara:strand:+ start:1561 stop:3189 length:1629 start_codon:yes stop_codon:yes gene_type:complete